MPQHQPVECCWTLSIAGYCTHEKDTHVVGVLYQNHSNTTFGYCLNFTRRKAYCLYFAANISLFWGQTHISSCIMLTQETQPGMPLIWLEVIPPSLEFPYTSYDVIWANKDEGTWIDPDTERGVRHDNSFPRDGFFKSAGELWRKRSIDVPRGLSFGAAFPRDTCADVGSFTCRALGKTRGVS